MARKQSQQPFPPTEFGPSEYALLDSKKSEFRRGSHGDREGIRSQCLEQVLKNRGKGDDPIASAWFNSVSHSDLFWLEN